MSRDEKRKLHVYKQYILLNEKTDVQMKEMISLCKYCVDFNLCVSEIPETRLFTKDHENMRGAAPEAFRILNQQVAWIDSNGNVLDVLEGNGE